MIIAILHKEYGDSFTTDDIAGKAAVVRDHWKAECMAPLGDATRPVRYSVPDWKTVKYTIVDYLARPSAYRERRKRR